MATFTPQGISESWKSLVDSEDDFDPINVSVHGISEASVRGAPTFPGIFESIGTRIEAKIVASHTAFERVSIRRAAERYALPEIHCRWLDTARVARRSWQLFAKSRYGLANVAEWCGGSFHHHRAEEGARAAGEILLRAIHDTGSDFEAWLERVKQPIDPSTPTTRKPISRRGNPYGPLSGEVIAFTGALSMHRNEAADLAAACGCDVAASVTKKTTLLVVGDQDIRRLAGHDRSSKHRKAESLIEQGQPIRILGESDFLRILETD